jgi:hypothetical protein
MSKPEPTEKEDLVQRLATLRNISLAAAKEMITKAATIKPYDPFSAYTKDEFS